ncbi:MAG: GNAT family N-acetyltransferase [Candidatus Goldbacteria bacterium]|nr:GNAT family N-acetyltransferase [Candidatus Goldiibacteriota bacterium]
MEIKQANQINIKDAVRLSAEVFNSSFLKESIMKEEQFSYKNIRLLYEGKKLVSMACVLPRHIYIDGVTVKAAGIAGVATAPDERGKGYAAIITRDALEYIEKERYALTYLNPYKTSYYKQFGYSPVMFPFKVIDLPDKLKIQHGYFIKRIDPMKKSDIKAMAQIHAAFCADKTGPVARSINTWILGCKYIEKEGKSEGIGISPAYIAYKGRKACGYLLIGPVNHIELNSLKISELCYLPGHEESVNALAEQAFKYIKQKGLNKIYYDSGEGIEIEGSRNPVKKEVKTYITPKYIRMYRSGNFQELKKVIIPLVIKRLKKNGIKGVFDIKRTKKNMPGNVSFYHGKKVIAQADEGTLMKMMLGIKYKTSGNSEIIKTAFPMLKPLYMDFDFL